jgi:hypothetical protein
MSALPLLSMLVVLPALGAAPLLQPVAPEKAPSAMSEILAACAEPIPRANEAATNAGSRAETNEESVKIFIG